LHHYLRLQCPQELGMMMREVSLNHIEELFIGRPCELRPALAIGDPTMPFVDRSQYSLVVVV
jgi:hypothetical protein